MQNQGIIKSNNNKNWALLIAAFAAVYLIWGSTYLGIKYAIETLPTFMMAGARFMTAGAILFLWARFSKDYEKPQAAQWRTSFIVGGLLLLGGNGGVIVAQHYIPSSLAALLVATEPFWVVILGWLMFRGVRPNLKVVGGLLLGFVGVFLLIGGRGLGIGTGDGQLFGTVLIIFSAASWAGGSLYGLRAPAPKSALLGAGMQMLAGGFLLMLVGIFTGEWINFSFADVSRNSWLALVYLTIFGSIIGFTAYSWLLKNVDPSLVSTYAYVNPVIAVLLGWFVAGESLTGQMLVGAGIIVSSVMLITSSHKKEAEPEETEMHESQMPTKNCKAISASV